MTMLDPAFKFSQSSLQDYTDCPRRFQLRYLNKLIYPAVETEPALENEHHLEEGQHFHRLAQQHLLGIPNEKLSRLANSPKLSRWWKNFLEFSHTNLTNSKSLYPEVTLSAPLGEFRLVAKYDLLTVTEDDRLSIYDWKTYRKRPRDEWLAARWQTKVYRALLGKVGSQFNGGKPILPEKCEMIYWFTEFPADAAHFPYSVAQFERDWAALIKLLEEIQSASSFPQTGDRQKCVYCPYRSYCNRGIQAGVNDNIEAELENTFDVKFEQIGEIAF